MDFGKSCDCPIRGPYENSSSGPDTWIEFDRQHSPGENSKGGNYEPYQPGFQRRRKHPRALYLRRQGHQSNAENRRNTQKAKSLVLIVDDPDAPGGNFTHWLIWNIVPDLSEIVANKLPAHALQGVNDFGKSRYSGPCPPAGVHRYYFRLYA